MDTQGKRENARGELMGDNIIGIFLSNELLQNPNTISLDPQPKLRRFVHHGKVIQCSRLLGSGEHGVVLVTIIEGVEYALKVFKQWKHQGQSSIQMNRPSTRHHSQTRAELLLDWTRAMRMGHGPPGVTDG